MEKVFLAFWWRKWQNIGLDKIIEKGSLILLNLERFTEDELNSYLNKQKIALPYPQIPKKVTLLNDVFNSWWIIYNIDYPDDYKQLLFLIELYVDDFLNPVFKFDRLWYEKLEYKKVDTFDDWYLDRINIDKLNNFLFNYKGIKDYSYWLRDRIYDWVKNNNSEAFRLQTWIWLYNLLKDYSYWKSILFWKREVMEIGILFETLFTEINEKESIWYALRKRIHFLSLDLIDNIENKIKEIYNTRSQFVHGAIFDELKKQYEIIDKDWEEDIKENYNNDMFKKTKEYITILRKILLLYFKLFERINSWEYKKYFNGWKKISCIDIIELSIFNKDIRDDLEKEKELLKDLIDY